MKKIFNFSQFVNENYSPLNEGGGAGIEFKISNIDVKSKYSVSASGIERTEQNITMADTFNAEGYDDGMSDVGTWMLKVIAEDPKQEDLFAIPISAIDDDILDGLNITGEDADKVKTIGDLFVVQPELVLDLVFDLSFKDYRQMQFGGWVRGEFKKGDVVIGDTKYVKYDTGDYDSVTFFDGGDSYELGLYGDKVFDIIDKMKPQVIATNRFVDFYNEVFRNNDENFDQYIKDELKDYDVEEGNVDDEIQEYIDNNDLGISIEEFKAEKDKYVNDEFVKFMRDKQNYTDGKWDNFWDQLKDEYGVNAAAGTEVED